MRRESAAAFAKYGTNGWEYNTSKALLGELTHNLLAAGAAGVFHSVWGIIAQQGGWMPPLTHP